MKQPPRNIPASVCQRLLNIARESGEDAVHDGIRIHFQASLDSARIGMQVDVGFGDAVTPAPQLITLPTLLGHPAPSS